MANANWRTYDQVGIKEDIDDVISNISPTKTPFTSMTGQDSCDNKFFQWQEDSLRAAASNTTVEGADLTDATPAATVMRDNVTQILTETVNISGTSDAVAHYGRAKESAYQLSKSMAQVKRDLEFAYVGSAAARNNGAAAVARVMAGFQQQLFNGGSGVLDADDFVLYTGGAGTAPTEGNLLTLLTHLYNQGAEPDTIMVTPVNSLVVADFAKAAGRYRTIENSRSDANGRTIVNVVDLYVSPFGEQRVVLNRFVKTGNTLVFEKAMWKKVSLRPWFRETLAKTGDALRMAVIGEYSLKHRNKSSSGAIVQAAGPTGF